MTPIINIKPGAVYRSYVNRYFVTIIQMLLQVAFDRDFDTSGRQAFTYNWVAKHQSIRKFFIFFWVIARVSVLGIKEKLFRIVFIADHDFILISGCPERNSLSRSCLDTTIKLTSNTPRVSFFAPNNKY